MIICDDYLALRVIVAGRPASIPTNEHLAMTPSTWWRLLRPAHTILDTRSQGTAPEITGVFSRIFAASSNPQIEAIIDPNPQIIEILDSRPLLSLAASLGTNNTTPTRRSGSLNGLESLAAAVHHNGALWYGRERNVEPFIANRAPQLGIDINIIDPT